MLGDTKRLINETDKTPEEQRGKHDHDDFKTERQRGNNGGKGGEERIGAQ